MVFPAGFLASMIIGAGMFALPYVFREAGIVAGLFYLVIFAGVFIAIHRMYAQIVVETKGEHRLVGYAKIYLGQWGFWVSLLTSGIGFLLILTAYLALASDFLGFIFPGLPGAVGLYIFWFVSSFAVLLSLRRLAKLEFVATVAIGAIIFTLFIAGLLRGGEVSAPLFNSKFVLVPYGVVLFSLSGRAAISSLYAYYKRRKLDVSKIYGAVTWGTIVPVILYIFFVLAIFLLSGSAVSPDALSGLVDSVPRALLMLTGFLGVFVLWTSYFFLGLEVKGVLHLDLGIKSWLATLVVFFAPIALYLSGLSNFIQLIGIAGGIFLAIESVLVVVIYSKLKGWRALNTFLVIVFLAGIIYQFFQLI